MFIAKRFLRHRNRTIGLQRFKICNNNVYFLLILASQLDSDFIDLHKYKMSIIYTRGNSLIRTRLSCSLRILSFPEYVIRLCNRKLCLDSRNASGITKFPD